MAGALYSTIMAHENQLILAENITTKMAIHLQGGKVPVQTRGSKMHGSSDSKESVYTTIIRCKKGDYTEVCDALLKLYGTDTANKDLTRPLVRFFPMSMLKSLASANDKFISRLLAFERHLSIASPRNLRGLNDTVHYQSDNEDSFKTTVGEILRNAMDHEGKHIFDAVIPHGTKPNTIILAGLHRNAGVMHKAK